MSRYVKTLLLHTSRQELYALVKFSLCCVHFSACLVGCTVRESPPSAGGLPPAPAKTKVVAQGQILPAGGIIMLAAAPGDVVETLAEGVTVGGEVKKDQVLVTMRSERVSQAKLETLNKRRDEAARERENTIATSQRQLAATQLKLQRIELQQIALQRKEELLVLSQQQVSASEGVLRKLQSISTNAVTSEFIGQLEIDRQRISLGEAKLSYRQQQELQLQAKEDLEFAKQAALEEQQAAQAIVDAAEASQAIEILELEIRALQEQANAARVVAPQDGVILAINASKGESSLPLPLIEMANLEDLICEIEINEMDATKVKEGQRATIRSRAFGKELTGNVDKKFRLVGRPQLRPLDPMARADFRTVMAVVKLDRESAAVASDWLQLQVEVSIDVGNSSSEAAPDTSPK